MAKKRPAKKTSARPAAKTRRTTSSSKGFERSTDAPLFISLSKGSWAYVFDATGHTTHCEVNSPRFVAAVTELLEAYPQKTRSELEAMKERYPDAPWTDVLAEASAAPA